MYTHANFGSLKELKQAIADGQKISIFAPGLGVPKQDGEEFVEGPHYPKPHKWYARVLMENGFIKKVLK